MARSCIAGRQRGVGAMCGQLLGRMSPQEATPFLARAVLRKDNGLKASIAPQSAAQRGTENDKITGKKSLYSSKENFQVPVPSDRKRHYVGEI